MPEEVVLTGPVNLGETPQGDRALIIPVSPFRQYVVPLERAQAEKIGKALSAPHVEIAQSIPPASPAAA